MNLLKQGWNIKHAFESINEGCPGSIRLMELKLAPWPNDKPCASVIIAVTLDPTISSIISYPSAAEAQATPSHDPSGCFCTRFIISVVKTIINHPYFVFLHPFMVILGMIYYCLTHMMENRWELPIYGEFTINGYGELTSNGNGFMYLWIIYYTWWISITILVLPEGIHKWINHKCIVHYN